MDSSLDLKTKSVPKEDTSSQPLLNLSDVSVRFPGRGTRPDVMALQGINLRIDQKKPEIVAIAGETGSGKSTLGGLVLGTVTPSKGSVEFLGRSIPALHGHELREHRKDCQAVLQDPFSAFNPAYRADHLLRLVMRNYKLGATAKERDDLIHEALSLVGLDPILLERYPHQLSGGQRQRLMMARASLLRPRLIVADEPVSMVDASMRRNILGIMRRMRDVFGISFLYITHDLATAYESADQLYVLSKGEIVESGPSRTVIEHPKHPYVKELLAAVPRVGVPWIDAAALSDEEIIENAPQTLLTKGEHQL